jgi:hypothetical protein
MGKVNLFILFLACLAATAFAQSNTRSFDLKNFDKVSLGSAFKIDLKQSSRFRVVALGTQRDLDDLEAKVSGGTLSIRYKEDRSRREKMTLEIEMPSLTGLDLSGASSTVASGFSGGERLNLDVSGAAKLTLDISVETLLFDLSGASAVTLTGKASVLKGDLSGASSLKASGFPVKEAVVDASGASSAVVNTSAKLIADASGASSIRYGGGGTDVRTNTSGGSSIKRLN